MVRVMKALVACAAFGARAGPFFISAARADDYADVAGLMYDKDSPP
jgi:hypothetical protein